LFAGGAIVLFPTAQALELATLRLVITLIGVAGYVALVLREVKTLRFWDIVDVTWRLLTAAGLMAICLQWVTFDTFPVTANLLLRCLAGAFLYSLALLALWLAAGRPKGGESYAYWKISGFLKR
jgi:hypothetical protein